MSDPVAPKEIPSAPSAAPASELALLLAAILTPLLPMPWAGAALLGLVLLWWRQGRQPRREGVVVALAFGAALLVLSAGWWRSWEIDRSERGWVESAERRYARLWRDLEDRVEEGVQAVGQAPTDSVSRLRIFHQLDRLTQASGSEALTLLLMDPDGEAVAWAGPGLLHDLGRDDLPLEGTHFRASYASASLLAVRRLDNDRRPWRVVAGVSLPTDELPFPAPLGEKRSTFRWSLVEATSGLPPAVPLLRCPGAPSMAVEKLAGGQASRPFWRRWPARLAWAAVGLALLALTVMRGVSLALVATRVVGWRRRFLHLACLGLAGLVSWGLAAEVAPASLILLLGAVVVALFGFRGPCLRGGAPRAAIQGGLSTWALIGAAWLLQHHTGLLDLGVGLGGPPAVIGLRLALVILVLGLLAWCRTTPPVRLSGGRRWSWIAAGLLVIAGAFHDFSLSAVLILGAAGAAAALWIATVYPFQRITQVSNTVLLAALIAAVAWETSYRLEFRHLIRQELLPGVAPPTRDEIDALKAELERYFQGKGLSELSPGEADGLLQQDLALVLWRDSPLARRDALSALVVEMEGRNPSSFAFGLPLIDGLELHWDSARWQDLGLPVWEEVFIAGENVLTGSGESRGRVLYWLLPRPGFRLGVKGIDGLEVSLLRGDPTAVEIAENLPSPSLYALYSPQGRALVAPWEGAPPLAAELAVGGDALVETPAGRAWGFAREGSDGVEVVYLPLLVPLAALQRVGTHTLSVLLVIAAALLITMLFALPRAAFRDLIRVAVRSYSKRLIIVYTVLLLVPLLLLNLLLLRGLERRLERQQQAAGEEALAAAQRVLGEYILSLEPGFGIDTQLDDELLVWLSRVVQHQVNLYWGSSVYASSKPELFTAGLLPKRVPGEVYARLVLGSFNLSSRTARAGGSTTYLELYAPLRIPGMPEGGERLLLSLPLLAQQQELAAELQYLARNSLLVTAALFILLVAVGTALARSFTTPLMQVVEGTGRIAAGETSLGLSPSEPELARLVGAIDEMARRIAEGRQRLLREKQVVERMVDNITAGVVSVDQEGGILLLNRVAAEHLRIEPGQQLRVAVSMEQRMAPVAAFLAEAGEQVSQTTVRLSGPGGAEREWRLVWVPVPGGGDPAALFVVEDVTQVLRGQRLAAWAEMARIIAHEIKNPLTPIRLSTEHMRGVWAENRSVFDEVFERCTANILRQVEELQQIASEFSVYSRIPRIEASPGDLVAAVEEVVEGYRAAPPPGVSFELRAENRPVRALFDERLLARAVRNLLENAVRASSGGGQVTVSISRDGESAEIAVSDQGPGVAPEVLPRIFDPYFSTYDSGTGLGLPISRRIAEQHGGTIVAENLPERGLRVRIRIPSVAP